MVDNKVWIKNTSPSMVLRLADFNYDYAIRVAQSTNTHKTAMALANMYYQMVADHMIAPIKEVNNG